MEQTDASKPPSTHVLFSIQALRCFAVTGLILFHIQHYDSNKLRMPGFLPQFDIGSAAAPHRAARSNACGHDHDHALAANRAITAKQF